MNVLRHVLSAAALAAIASCDGPVPETEGAQITMGNAFLMEPAGGRDITMGGLDISVSGDPVRLIGARSDIAETIELHTMSMQDGQMQMRQVNGFEIVEGETLQLERGGDHLMLFGIDPLTVGDKYELELTFELEDGETEVREVMASVRALGE